MPDTDPSTGELTLGDLVEFAIAPLEPPTSLARWSEHPTVHIRVKPGGALLVGLANRPTQFEAVLSPEVYVGLDRTEAGADVTTVCLLHADNPDPQYAELVRDVVGPTAWRHAQDLLAAGGGDRNVILSAVEAATLTRAWPRPPGDAPERGVPAPQGADGAAVTVPRPTDPSHPSPPSA